MKKLSFLAIALFVVSVSACKKDAVVSPTATIKAQESVDFTDPTKPMFGIADTVSNSARQITTADGPRYQ